MNYSDIANGLIFQKMDIKNDSFTNRLICQKKIYLLQSLGTNIGYSYNWYKRGPYSPDLTEYVYENLSELRELNLSDYSLSDESIHNEEIVEKLAEDKPDGLSLEWWYELLASLAYISDNKTSWHVVDKSSLFGELISHKPRFNIQLSDYAFNCLEKNNFPGIKALV